MHHHRVPCPKRNLHTILPLTWAEPYAIPLKDISFYTVRQHSPALPHYRAAADISYHTSSPANFTFHPNTVAKIISMSFQKL